MLIIHKQPSSQFTAHSKLLSIYYLKRHHKCAYAKKSCQLDHLKGVKAYKWKPFRDPPLQGAIDETLTGNDGVK